jgi:hypothetical protein
MEFTIYADKSGYGIGIEARLRDENNLNKNEISEDGYITLLIYWDGSAELELTNNDSRVNNANGSRVYKVSAAQFLKDI